MQLTKLGKAIILLMTAILCVVCLGSVPIAYAADVSENPILILQKGSMENNKVEIIAKLTKNPGIWAMTLNLNYGSALKLVKAENGSALSSLSPVHSGRLDVNPYAINYVSNGDNDYSTGVLLKFIFEIKDDAEDGVYEITLKSKRKEVAYLLDGKLHYKSLVTDSVSITVQGDQTSVEIVEGVDTPTDDGFTKTLILSLSLGALGVVAVIVATVLILKKGTRVCKK